VPAFSDVGGLEHIVAFGETHGWPVVAKAQRDGYDGRGVWVVGDRDEAEVLVAEAASNGVRLLVEQFIPIEAELAGLIVRRPNGEHAVYPVVETVQRDGICVEVVAPAVIPETIRARAEELTVAVAEAVGVVGNMALELFLVGGELSVNEIATRPHNSGHFSIEACGASQFENHLRAILDWPLGDTALRAPAAVMANLLGRGAGQLDDGVPAALGASTPGVHPHLYGKAARDGRKIGHVTALGDDPEETRARANAAADTLMAATA
jgi:5-(carboxyamino)imidazole ribonucleotide synthase